MNDITFSFASLIDVDAIMTFLHEHWKKDHILSTNKELLLRDFAEGNKLNIGIVKDGDGALLGIFGFIKYNSLPIPDIAGSLWKVTSEAQKNIPC